MPETNSADRSDGTFSYRKGKWWPLWSLLLVPFLIILIPLYRAVREDINWKATWLTVLVFEAVLLPAEWYALTRGHWVYNEARIWGPKIFGIPIEEPLLYYFFSPIFLICLLHLVLRIVQSKKTKEGR